jgi:hypothetical protein
LLDVVLPASSTAKRVACMTRNLNGKGLGPFVAASKGAANKEVVVDPARPARPPPLRFFKAAGLRLRTVRLQWRATVSFLRCSGAEAAAVSLYFSQRTSAALQP